MGHVLEERSTDPTLMATATLVVCHLEEMMDLEEVEKLEGFVKIDPLGQIFRVGDRLVTAMGKEFTITKIKENSMFKNGFCISASDGTETQSWDPLYLKRLVNEGYYRHDRRNEGPVE